MNNNQMQSLEASKLVKAQLIAGSDPDLVGYMAIINTHTTIVKQMV